MNSCMHTKLKTLKSYLSLNYLAKSGLQQLSGRLYNTMTSQQLRQVTPETKDNKHKSWLMHFAELGLECDGRVSRGLRSKCIGRVSFFSTLQREQLLSVLR